MAGPKPRYAVKLTEQQYKERKKAIFMNKTMIHQGLLTIILTSISEN
ncbi:MAG: hypothetical protein PHG14_09910 [Desulfobacter postgatei]|nr:hypothetical protein [Desulfobacter postgatei]MDD4274025.1 hypothetical protein [Desulfobacter postgatei]